MSIALNGDGIISGVSSITVGAGASVFSPAANTLALGTNNSERVRVDSSGNIGVGTNLVSFSQFGSNTNGVAIQDIGATNTGIKLSDGSYHNYLVQAGNGNLYLSHYGSGGDIIFGTGANGEERARLLFAGGLTFNGDTAAANALDDYEEGTWTPEIVGSSSAGTVTYGLRNGKYTKIGRQVFIEVYVSYSSGAGGTGGLRITGLPFTVSSSGSTYPGLSIGYFDSISLTANTTPLSLFASGDTYIYFYQIPSGGGTNVDIPWDGAGSIILSGCYTV